MIRIGSARVVVVACFFIASSAAFPQIETRNTGGEPALSPEQIATLARHDELQAAIVKQDAARVSALIRSGMPLDFNFDAIARGRTRQSALTLAISLARAAIAAKSLEAVRFFKQHGADIDAQNHRGMTALAEAVERANLALLESLIAGGAGLDAPLKGPGLFTAAVKGNHAALPNFTGDSS